MDFVAGYRLIRLLGSGKRADVFLGQAEHLREPQLPTADAGSPREVTGEVVLSTAAIKVWRPGTERAVIDLEVAALSRLRSPHLMRLQDIALANDGLPVLVNQRLNQVSLARLLEKRGQLSAGEAVTVIAPLATAVAEMHRSGVAHRRLRLGAVLFDDSMAPVITSFGRAVLIGPPPRTSTSSSLTPAALAAEVTVERDLADLAALARTIIESTPETADRDRLLVWLAEVSVARTPHRFPHELADRVFELADALPIDLHAARPEVPQRTPVLVRDELFREAMDTGASAPARSSAVLRSLIPEWIADHIDDSPGAAIAASVRRGLSQVRRPVWIALAAAVVLLIGAVVLVPGGDRSQAATAPSEPAPIGAPTVGSETTVESENTVESETTVESENTVESETTVESGSPSPPSQLTSDQLYVLAGDDLVAAARVILEQRAECFSAAAVSQSRSATSTSSEAGVTCLALIEYAESAAIDYDADLLATSAADEAALEATRLAECDLQLDDQLGGSAIISVIDRATGRPTASLLLVKGEAGWLLRDLIRL